jgi:hypothetical protein
MNTKSQVDFDHLLQLHMLNKTEEDNDMSWKYYNVVDYCKEKVDVNTLFKILKVFLAKSLSPSRHP